MRTSEYLALGRTILKPLAGVSRSAEGDAGCALGMIQAAGGNCAVLSDYDVVYPCNCDLSKPLMGSGCGSFYPDSNKHLAADFMVVHLFNYHVMTAKDWTLDQLIDWLRSVEPADPEEPQKLGPEPAKEKPVRSTVSCEELVCP